MCNFVVAFQGRFYIKFMFFKTCKKCIVSVFIFIFGLLVFYFLSGYALYVSDLKCGAFQIVNQVGLHGKQNCTASSTLINTRT